MITLSDAEWAAAAIASRQAKYLVSLLSPTDMIETPSGIVPENHLKLTMDDITGCIDGLTPPNKEHVDQLLDFGSNLDESSEVVVHCVMGMSRSPAAVLILLAQHNPGREAEIADLLFQEVPQINPNKLLLQIGDDAMGCGGILLSAAYIDAPLAHDNETASISSIGGFHSFPLRLHEVEQLQVWSTQDHGT